MKPVGSIVLPNAKVDVWRESLVSHMPDGTDTPSVPQPGQSMVENVGHEVAHHIVAWLTTGGPSRCLSAGGSHRTWEGGRGDEEALALQLGPVLAELMIVAQRLPWQPRNQLRKLTAEEVRAIRRDYAPRRVTMAMLAEKYGVTDTAIDRILKRATYKEVAEENG